MFRYFSRPYCRCDFRHVTGTIGEGVDVNYYRCAKCGRVLEVKSGFRLLVAECSLVNLFSERFRAFIKVLAIVVLCLVALSFAF